MDMGKPMSVDYDWKPLPVAFCGGFVIWNQSLANCGPDLIQVACGVF